MDLATIFCFVLLKIYIYIYNLYYIINFAISFLNFSSCIGCMCVVSIDFYKVFFFFFLSDSIISTNRCAKKTWFIWFVLVVDYKLICNWALCEFILCPNLCMSYWNVGNNFFVDREKPRCDLYVLCETSYIYNQRTYFVGFVWLFVIVI